MLASAMSLIAWSGLYGADGGCVLASGAGALQRRGRWTPQWADSALPECSPGRLLEVT
jgi:hypothetical protein